MIEIKYVSSDNQVYYLVTDKLRVTKGNFGTYKWKPRTGELRYGTKIQGFDKDAITYSLTVTLRGKLADQKQTLDQLHESFEYDIKNETQGRIYYGEYYIGCYIIEAETKTSDTIAARTTLDIEVYCPYPFWTKETTFIFLPTEDTHESDKTSYPKDYMYDYVQSDLVVRFISNDSYFDCDFILRIYGLCTNPTVVIGENSYTVNCTIEDGEYLVIDSTEKKIYLVTTTGGTVNRYTYRDRDHYIFEQIKTGTNIISWNGTFGVDVVLVERRSEPKWI